MFEVFGSGLLAFTWGTQEIVIVAIVGLLLFGGARLPSLMRNMGRSINEFKAGMKDKPSDKPDEKLDADEEDEQDKID